MVYVDLGIAFEERGVLLGEVAVEGEAADNELTEIGALVEGGAVVGRRSHRALSTEALSTRIEVAPDTEVEGEHADRRADTAVDVDLSRGAVREGDALERGTDIELDVLVDVVARLEIGGDRRLVVRLGDAAEHVVAHDGATERDIPGIERRRRRGLHGFDRHVRGQSRTRNHCQRRCQQHDFLHFDPHHFPRTSPIPAPPRGIAISGCSRISLTRKQSGSRARVR